MLRILVIRNGYEQCRKKKLVAVFALYSGTFFFCKNSTLSLIFLLILWIKTRRILENKKGAQPPLSLLGYGPEIIMTPPPSLTVVIWLKFYTNWNTVASECTLLLKYLQVTLGLEVFRSFKVEVFVFFPILYGVGCLKVSSGFIWKTIRGGS